MISPKKPLAAQKPLAVLMTTVFATAATVAAAGSVPSTKYQYDNNGNLHGTAIEAIDPTTGTSVMTPANCGAYGNTCPVPTGASATCSVSCTQDACTGLCGFTCNAGYAMCSGSCVVLASDANNCGACGNACPVVEGGHRTCVSGACQATCDLPYALCPEGANAYICVDVASGAGACGVSSGGLGDEECVVSPSEMVRVDADVNGDLVAHRLQDCSLVPQLQWPTPVCSGGVCL